MKINIMKPIYLLLFVLQFAFVQAQNIKFTGQIKLFDLPGDNLKLRNPFKPILVENDPNYWFFGFNNGNCLGFKLDTLTGTYSSVKHTPITANQVVLDVRDYNGAEGYEILTDSEIYYYNNTGNYWTYSFINLFYKVMKGYGDFNNDGKMDIIAESDDPFEKDLLYLLLNEGDNKFSTTEINSSTNEIETMATGDLDNNGFLDFVVTQSSGKPVKIFFNNGDSTFTKKEISGVASLCCNTLSIELIDMDGDGDLDMLIPGKFSGIYIVENVDNFAANITLSQPQIKNVDNLILVKAHDFNKDGFMDIVYVNQLQNSWLGLYILQGKEGNSFFPPKEIIMSRYTTQVGFFDGTAIKENMHFVDMNGDGFTDITFTSSENKNQFYLEYVKTSSAEDVENGIHSYFTPSLTNDFLYSSAPKGSISTMFDMFGSKILEVLEHDRPISIQGIPSGTYFIFTYYEGKMIGKDRVTLVK